MRNYIFIFQDKQQNELKRTEIQAKNMQQAKELAKQVLANSMLNALHTIKVRPSTKILKVTFENYYSRLQSVYVAGTYDQNKAINAVKKDQSPMQFVYKKCELVGESESVYIDINL